MKTFSFLFAGFAIALAFAALPACSAIVGIKDLPSDDGNSSGGGGSGGSGSGGSSSDKDVRFVGTWTISSGLNTVSCAGSTPSVTDDVGTMHIVRGTSTDLVITPPNGCALAANVTSTNEATLVAGQTCSGRTADGTGEVTFFPAGTFDINATGTQGVVNVNGEAEGYDEGESAECPFAQQDNYTPDRLTPPQGTRIVAPVVVRDSIAR